MHDHILFGYPSISERQTQPDEGSQINFMAEAIGHRKDEQLPQPQAFLPETLRTPSVRCCLRNPLLLRNPESSLSPAATSL